MFKRLLFVLVVLGFAGSVSAQTLNYYSSKETCLAGKGSFYEPAPTTKLPQKLAADEIIYRPRYGGCADMDLPEALAKRGWVPLAPGDRLVAAKADRKIKRHAFCDNIIHEFVEFSAPAPIRDQVMRVDFGKIEGSVEHRVSGAVDVRHSGEVEQRVPSAEPKKRSWTRHLKWIVPVAGGVAVGGYLGYRAWDRDGDMILTINNVIR